MDTALVYAQRVKKITPRLVEIMNRLILGQKGKEIQDEFGITPSRFSIIINSPLFKLELRKRMMKREEKLLDIQENLLEGAKLGSQLYKDILDSKSGHPTETRLKAANSATSLVIKMLHSPDGGNGDVGGVEEGKSYEERLREVTIKESVKMITTPSKEGKEKDEIEALLVENYPPEVEEELMDEKDLLFGHLGEGEEGGEGEGEEGFEPTEKIEDILPRRKENGGSITDSV